jgi:hypothetical protein
MSESKLFNALREEDRQAAKNKKGGGPLRYVLIAGILILIAFNVLFVDWGGKESGKGTPGGGIQPVTPTGETPSQSSTGPGLASINEGNPDDGNQARQLIDDVRERGNTTDPETLFAQAGSYVQKGQMADAYLIYFYLAKQGHGPSTLVLAEMADPAYFDAKTSFYDAPDFAQAHKWYLQAMMLGMSKAEAQLRDLKLRVKAAAAGGDEKARRLLVGW